MAITAISRKRRIVIYITYPSLIHWINEDTDDAWAPSELSSIQRIEKVMATQDNFWRDCRKAF